MRAIPYFTQENDHVCGPATVQMALAAFGQNVPQAELDRELETPRDPDKGTEPEAMLRVVSTHGLKAEVIAPATLADIQDALEKDMVVIICYSEPEQDMGHYAIVADVSEMDVILHDPYHGPSFTLSHEEFERRWHDRMFTHTTQWMMRIEENTSLS